ncbi:MFS transporter [Leucobacter aridicollis]|uniref:MFS transporter n=1 Tax=Leucobacter aridicollis TaxID=283878 RepID=UPI000E65B13E|nr:MFS transporter [Leucobacter aridicollis]UTX54368.1 MFS transporter [Leucobacter aridicollis]
MTTNTAAQPNRAHESHGYRNRLPLELGGKLQRRTLIVLSTATILGGLGFGASASVGALLLAEVSGNDAISGLAAAMSNAGAAAAGIPLARIAARRGRRAAVVLGSSVAMLGALLAISGAAISQWWVLALGIGILGVASAVQLLSRFAATDLALPENRARDLSLVVWSITVGAVIGPNLMGPGAVVGGWIGVTPLAGVFVFTFFAQLAAVCVNYFGLRPDPLLTARALQAEAAQARDAGPETATEVAASRGAKILAIVIIGMAQAIMVGLMAMTPLHLKHHGGSDALVGITLSLHIAGMYALSPVFGILAGKIGRLPVIVGGWAILLVAIYFAYLSGENSLYVQIAMTLVGVGWSAVTVAGAALLTDLTALGERPKWQGRADTFMSASGAAAGVLAGIVFAMSDFSILALVALALLTLGAIASMYPKLRVARQH